MAMNSSPGRIVRESIETPASRATGSSAPPGLEPTAAAICAIVQSIKSSADLVCVQKQAIAMYFSFWHPIVSGSAKNRVLRVVLFQCPRAWLTPITRASSVPNYRCTSRDDYAFLLNHAPILMQPYGRRWIFITSLDQRGSRLFAIVKLQGAIGKNPVVLMAFSRQQNDVPRASFIHRQTNGLFAVRLDHISAGGFLHP